jgi:hypothetical protein
MGLAMDRATQSGSLSMSRWRCWIARFREIAEIVEQDDFGLQDRRIKTLEKEVAAMKAQKEPSKSNSET